ncbi:amino acid adenylation domain-containing protein [Catenulispora sp. EB89]|uniref:amino acid adenylation domain-containing protein n=1 Tax=Catenulispora sp. EB89 TaxID=3156257 RepID=UPI003515FA1B
MNGPVPDPSDRPFVCEPSPLQRRIWEQERAFPGSVQPVVRVLRFRGPVGSDAVYTAVRMLATENAALRSAFVLDATGELLALVGAAAPVPVLIGGGSSDEVETFEEFVSRPFSLSGPLFRIRFDRDRSGSGRLVLVGSPAVGDHRWFDALAARLAETIVRPRNSRDLLGILLQEPAVSRTGLIPAEAEFPADRPRPALVGPTWSSPIRVGRQSLERLATTVSGGAPDTELSVAVAVHTVAARWLDRRRMGVAVCRGAHFSVTELDYRPTTEFRSQVDTLADVVPGAVHPFPPLDAASVVLRPAIQAAGPAASVHGELTAPPSQHAAVEFTFTIADEPQAILSARRDVVSEKAFHGMAEALVMALDTFAGDPQTNLGAAELASASDLAGSATFAKPPVPAAEYGMLLHQLFEAQAGRTPDSPAVIFDGAVLSYQELNARADRLACALAHQGIGSGSVVALCFERSAALLTATLAVLKVGAAYLPLVSELPPERLALILDDCRPRAVIATRQMVERVPGRHCARLLILEDLLEAAGAEPQTDLDVRSSPEDLAYIVYTSGSTGRPKGVMVRHKSLVSRILCDSYEPTVLGEKYLLTTAPSFMDSNWETFTPLSSGGTIVIPTDAESRDAWRLIELAGEHGVRRLVIVPSLLSAILELPASALKALSAVQWCLCSGEPLPQAVLDRAARALPTMRVANVYGLSETWDVCWADATKTREAEVIGRPMPHSELHVLDAGLLPSPAGVSGQLYAAGAGLARGYLCRPAQTAERFVPNPYGPPGSRMYRTGDRVRWRDDGMLEFIGRMDRQVKIRGFRVELEEVETVLSALVGFETVVVAEQGDRARLTAFAAVPEESRLDARTWRARLASHLPDYMMPAEFIWLDAFPLTANGKVNRLELSSARPRRSVAYRPARTGVEQLLVSFCAQEAGRPGTGLDDPLDGIGVGSVVRMQLKIRSLLGIEVTLADLLEAGSLSEVSDLVSRMR